MGLPILLAMAAVDLALKANARLHVHLMEQYLLLLKLAAQILLEQHAPVMLTAPAAARAILLQAIAPTSHVAIAAENATSRARTHCAKLPMARYARQMQTARVVIASIKASIKFASQTRANITSQAATTANSSLGRPF